MSPPKSLLDMRDEKPSGRSNSSSRVGPPLSQSGARPRVAATSAAACRSTSGIGCAVTIPLGSRRARMSRSFVGRWMTPRRSRLPPPMATTSKSARRLSRTSQGWRELPRASCHRTPYEQFVRSNRACKALEPMASPPRIHRRSGGEQVTPPEGSGAATTQATRRTCGPRSAGAANRRLASAPSGSGARKRPDATTAHGHTLRDESVLVVDLSRPGRFEHEVKRTHLGFASPAHRWGSRSAAPARRARPMLSPSRSPVSPQA